MLYFLTGHPTIQPKSFVDAGTSKHHSKDYIFLCCIDFINQVSLLKRRRQYTVKSHLHISPGFIQLSKELIYCITGGLVSGGACINWDKKCVLKYINRKVIELFRPVVNMAAAN